MLQTPEEYRKYQKEVEEKFIADFEAKNKEFLEWLDGQIMEAIKNMEHSFWLSEKDMLLNNIISSKLTTYLYLKGLDYNYTNAYYNYDIKITWD